MKYIPKEFKIVPIRECSVLARMMDCPERIAAYWREFVATDRAFRPEQEQLVVVLLNTRRNLIGHVLVGLGTLDGVLMTPREVFRPAMLAAASAICLCHNHPSGDPSPSDSDIKVTRDMIRAGQILKIDLLDHVIIGQPSATNPGGYASLRELGYFRM